MGERRDYEATNAERLVFYTRGRLATRRNETILGARERGVFKPLAKVTSARPPFAPDEPMDDDEE